MEELHPDYLEDLNTAKEDHPKLTRLWPKQLSSILDLIQAFSIYMAVLSRSQPHHIPSCMAYLHLLIHSHTHFRDFNWASYDRQFRQKASACQDLDWATKDGTLWNLGCIEEALYKTHRAQPPDHSSTPICLEWNDYPSGCSHGNSCRYNHICYQCVNLPTHVDYYHRAALYPNKAKGPQLNPKKGSYQQQPITIPLRK